MKNKEIAEIFNRIATFLEIKDDNVFKIRAYRKAADVIEGLSEDIEDIRRENRILAIVGIGAALENKIIEYIDTGRITAYEKLIKKIPESILGVISIPSVGPKKAKLFFKELKIKNIDELEKAAKKGRLLGLTGVQDKTVENILKGIKLIKEGQERMDLGSATYIAESFVSFLREVKEVKQISVAGSLRRQKETVRDIDILVASTNAAKVIDAFVGLPQVARIIAKGETKSSVLTKDNVQVDLRVVDPKVFGAALLYFTGSKNFNVKLRRIAIREKMKVSEYGLFSTSGKKERFLCGKTEGEMLRKLGLNYIPPELREDIAGDEIYSLKKLPRLVNEDDIKGDLHVHSTWSDGRSTILELVKATKDKGYSYLAVCDHSASLRVASGLSTPDLKKKKNEIDKINSSIGKFCVFFGTEVEVDTNGNLDYNDKILREFDIVIAAIHSGFKQSSGQLTKRIIKACQNKHVHMIAHPTGTHVGKRNPYDIDLKEVCKAAVDTNTFLEINAFPVRLDLGSSNVYYARGHGVKFAINTDAHSSEQLDFMRFGVSVARRGWLQKEDVINTLPLEKLTRELSR